VHDVDEEDEDFTLQHGSTSTDVLVMDTDFKVSLQKCMLTLTPVVNNRCNPISAIAKTFFIIYKAKVQISFQSQFFNKMPMILKEGNYFGLIVVIFTVEILKTDIYYEKFINNFIRSCRYYCVWGV
jgi:hypothetical protein